MRSTRARLRVDGLEQRLTPATVSPVLISQQRVAAGAAFFRSITTDPGWIFNASFKTFVTDQLTTIVHDSQTAITNANAATGVPAAALTALKNQALVNEQEAIKVGHWIGINVAPAAPVVNPPAPKPTDAGMVNTMPSPTDPHWVAVGTQGLKEWDTVIGAGTPVAAGDTISVFYTGWLASNGTKFDSRRSPAAPATFALSGLIQGWQQGIPGMKPGGIRRLFVPSALGYGAAGSPPNIPANADLVFEIKLISHHA